MIKLVVVYVNFIIYMYYLIVEGVVLSYAKSENVIWLFGLLKSCLVLYCYIFLIVWISLVFSVKLFLQCNFFSYLDW